MTDKYQCSNQRPPEQDLLTHIAEQGAFDNLDLVGLNLGVFFHEYTLEELGLPTAKTLLGACDIIELGVGLRGWGVKGVESETYKGFSLTYNPDFEGRSDNHHQTMGSPQLTQLFSREVDTGHHSKIRNSYYDTYAFRGITPLVSDLMEPLLSRFSMPLLRSRVAYRYANGCNQSSFLSNHVDEFPYQLLRVNIPLQTTPEQCIVIEGHDGQGTHLNVVRHLEVGKAYIWNTRVPHRNALTGPCTTDEPRIHMVLGFSPWFDYDSTTDTFTKGKHWGVPLATIINEKLFLQSAMSSPVMLVDMLRDDIAKDKMT